MTRIHADKKRIYPSRHGKNTFRQGHCPVLPILSRIAACSATMRDERVSVRDLAATTHQGDARQTEQRQRGRLGNSTDGETVDTGCNARAVI